MRYWGLVVLTLPLILTACSFGSKQGTLAELDDVELELKDEKVEGGLEKAMASYKQFLEETPESAMTPEAIRRIADLSIEKEYGYISEGGASIDAPSGSSRSSSKSALDKPKTSGPASGGSGSGDGTSASSMIAASSDESDKDFEKRVAEGDKLEGESSKDFSAPVPEGSGALQNANAEQAIRLYQKLLKEYPLYERNDQVLYQMSRAYEEIGQMDKAMEVMNQFIKSYPNSKYMDEVQFRRAEYFYTRNKYLDSEDAYKTIVAMGPNSGYYELAVYKLGWSYYKQAMYEEALDQYIALLDYKVSKGYDFDQETDKGQKKRMDDTYRVISLSFSNLGGPQSVVDYFSRKGQRSYEDRVYSHLGEFYLTKRRYNDAAEAYKTYVGLYPYSEVAPHFHMRVVEIYKKAGFGKLVVEAKKDFAKTYALDAEYWNYFEVSERPDVVGFLKSNLKDLANHYHALYQDKRFEKEKENNYLEALLWYRSYLSSFPKEPESPGINFQMAELMLQNKDYGEAAVAYENTAYNYPRHEKSAEAGYAAVYAHREHLKIVPPGENGLVKQQIIKSSLKFADTYPEHEKVTIVLGAAADDLYEMKNYELAVKTAHKLIDNYPQAEKELRHDAWLVVAHSSFELRNYADAENGYLNVLELTPKDDESRVKLVDNLAASIYKQGEQANLLEDYQTAAMHFLRVGKLAPTSKIRPSAEYDGAAALIKLKDWDRAATVLVAFRKDFPGHELQPEVTKKIAFVYREAGKLELAAGEYERIERESSDEQVRRGSLLIAADLYKEIGAKRKELAVYKRYVGYFPRPTENAVEIYDKMASVYKDLGETNNYMSTLEKIVAADETAGDERTDRTRYLAAQAALVLAEPLYDRFVAVKLVQPIKQTMGQKKEYMVAARTAYKNLIEYQVADVTAAATYYLAEIYYEFSTALKNSERPDNLSALEMEQYELMLEDQIFPFEEKAIDIHKKNIELLHSGIASSWIDKSLARLAKLYPAAYARDEQGSKVVATIDSYFYAVKGAEPPPQPAGGAGQNPATVDGQASATPAAEATTTESQAGAQAEQPQASTLAPAQSPVTDTAVGSEAAVSSEAEASDTAAQSAPEDSQAEVSEPAAANTGSETVDGAESDTAVESESDAAAEQPDVEQEAAPADSELTQPEDSGTPAVTTEESTAAPTEAPVDAVSDTATEGEQAIAGEEEAPVSNEPVQETGTGADSAAGAERAPVEESAQPTDNPDVPEAQTEAAQPQAEEAPAEQESTAETSAQPEEGKAQDSPAEPEVQNEPAASDEVAAEGAN